MEKNRKLQLLENKLRKMVREELMNEERAVDSSDMLKEIKHLQTLTTSMESYIRGGGKDKDYYELYKLVRDFKLSVVPIFAKY